MRKLLSIVVAGALVAGLIATVSAQGAGPKGGQKSGVQPGQGGPGGPRGGGQRARMADLMKKIQPPLTADQTKKIEAINSKFREDMQKLRGAGGPGRQGQQGQQGQRQQGARPDMAKFMELNKKRMDAINKVLSKKQQESFKKLTAEMMQRFQQGRGPGGAAGNRPPGGGAKPPAKNGSGKGG